MFLFVTHSVLGALPLGILVTSDEKTQTLTDGFNILKDCFPENSFNFKGCPEVMMTDNCSELHDALRNVWPEAKLILCVFHLLQQVWRWLNEKKHGIQVIDRAPLLSLFKQVVYAESVQEMEEKYELLLSDKSAKKYAKFVSYVGSVYETKHTWAICYRQPFLLRGSNTNNYVEAQFGVLKDGILRRYKEYNINALLQKLLVDFNNHYKDKLLSVASGSFDGIYSRRYLGKKRGKKDNKKDGVSFRVPTLDEQNKALEGIIALENNVFVVPSLSGDQTLNYLVDMTAGVCSCKTGSDGSPCKHQYILWANGRSNCGNFLPIFNKEERQKYANIALGECMPLEFYEGLHDRIMQREQPITLSAIRADSPNQTLASLESEFEINDFVPAEENNICGKDQEIETVINALDDVVSILKNKLNDGERSLATGIMKFAKRVKNMPSSKLPSAFHLFGTDKVVRAGVNSQGVLKKSRGKISVQPGAVQRRKRKCGSRQQQSSGRKVGLSIPVPKKKRAHDFSENVKRNENVPKKAGRTMLSKTKIQKTKCSAIKSEVKVAAPHKL